MAQIDISKFASDRQGNPYWDEEAGRLRHPSYEYMGYGGQYRYDFDKITPARRIAKETDLIPLIKAGEQVDLIVTNGHVNRMTANFAKAILEEVYRATDSTKAIDRVKMNYYGLNDLRKKFKRKVLAETTPTTWSKPQQMMIPDIGTVIRLTKDWTFNLYFEYRNSDLYAGLGLVKEKNDFTQVTLKKGAELKIDRVYIRKGADDYSSITFFADKGAEFTTGKKTLCEPKRRIRFWAKLGDVNGIQCSVDETTVRTDG